MPLPPPKLLAAAAAAAAAAAQAGDKRHAGRSSTVGKPPLPVAPRPPRRPESVSSMTASSIEALDAILPDDDGKPKFVLGDGDTLSVGSSGCNNNRRSPSTCAKPNPPARRSSIAQQNSTATTPQKPHQQHSSALSHSAAATPLTLSESAAAAARTSARLSALIVELQSSPGSSEASKQAAVSSELKLALLSRMLKSSTPPAQQHQHQHQHQHQQPSPGQPQLMSSFARGGATPVPLPVIPCSAEWTFRDRLMRDIERGVQLRNLPLLQQPPPQMRK